MWKRSGSPQQLLPPYNQEVARSSRALPILTGEFWDAAPDERLLLAQSGAQLGDRVDRRLSSN